jgi:mono/diheme cytochrome c family protein
MDAEEYIFTSVVKPDAYQAPGSSGNMPNNLSRGLSPSQIIDLTAFLCGKGGEIRPARLLAMEERLRSLPSGGGADQLDLGSLQRGKALFTGKLGCATCHSLSTLPGADLKAPSLLQVGANSRDRIKSFITSPGSLRHPSYESYTLELRDGTLISGRKLPARTGEKSVLVFDESGGAVARTIAEHDLEPESQSTSSPDTRRPSPMPAYGGSMTSQDLDDLVNFLSTLQ